MESPPGNHSVAVFWDYENCEVPATSNGFAVANGIRRIAHQFGSVKTFKAYSAMPDASSLRTTTVRIELQSCGVSLIDCPHNGRKDTADKMMIVDMLAFASDCDAPATIVLITGDSDFLYAVSTLRLRKYDIILLASPQCSSLGLKNQASAVYDWPRAVLSTELPEPSSPAPIGSVLATLASTHSKISSPAGRYGAPSWADVNRPSLSYATAAGNVNKAVSQPNTPQSTEPQKLPSASTAQTRPRASSVQQLHSRSTSMPVVPQTQALTSMSHGTVTPRIQTPQGNVQVDNAQRQGRHDNPSAGKSGQLSSPWRPVRNIADPSNIGSLSPLAPTMNVDVTHDLTSHEEEGAEENDSDARVQDGFLRTGHAFEELGSQGITPPSSVYLTPAEDGLQQVYDRPPIQLPALLQDRESLLVGQEDLTASSSSLDSEATVRAEAEIPPGHHMVIVREDVVIPSVDMIRIRTPPQLFEAMVNALEEERLRGNTRVISSQLGGKILQSDKHIYKKANVTKLAEYIGKAKERGIVITGDLGGPMSSNGNIWVALHPVYHGKPPPPPSY